jgi:predicted metal-dependent phosphoesterase TrpH
LAPVAPPKTDGRHLSREARYYSGNLHCHSTHSDGGRSFEDLIRRNKEFEDLIRRNKEFGFEYVASTEHNTPTAIFDFPKAEKIGPLLLIGTEVTMPGGHAGLIGQRPGYWWDFRTDPGDGGLKSIVAEAKRQGAVMIINHPFATCTTCG